MNQADKELVASMIESALHRKPLHETAYIHPEGVEKLLEILRSKLAGVVGVTLVQDANGQFGPMGATYLTMRYTDPVNKKDLIEVKTVVTKVSSRILDSHHRASQLEDK